jgi:hypothetical protein
MKADELKELIFDMIDKIDNAYLLQRIYNLVEYIYIHKAGK